MLTLDGGGVVGPALSCYCGSFEATDTPESDRLSSEITLLDKHLDTVIEIT